METSNFEKHQKNQSINTKEDIKMNSQVHSKETIEQLLFDWDDALKNNDMERLLNLYAPDAIIESPIIAHLLQRESGICQGRDDFKKVLELVEARKPLVRKHYKNKYFTDGTTLIWEYPRATPEGDQIDFVEVMELNNGKIQCHRVYWGWYGMNVLKKDQYHR